VAEARARDGWREYAVVGALSLAVAAVSFLFQPQIAVNNGQGWDGRFYYRMAEEFVTGQPIVTEGPFVYRLFAPFAAAVLSPSDLMLGFEVVNAVAIVLTIVLMVAWFRLHLTSWTVRIVLMALFLTQWTGPVRAYFWYPVLSDYWLVPVLLAGLLVTDRLRRGGRLPVWLPILTFLTVVGVTMRESALLIAVAALFTYNPITGRLSDLADRAHDLLRIPRVLALPGLLGAATFGVIHLLVTSTTSYAFARAAAGWLLRKWPNTYLQAWLIAFGPILVVPIFYWRACLRFLWDHQDVAAFLLALAGLSYIGGGDTERFLSWGAPAIYLMIGIGLEELRREQVHPLFLVVLIVTQAISARLLWVLPAVALEWEQVSEFVVLTPIGSNVSVFNVTAWDAEPIVRAISQIEYALVTLLLLGMLAWMHRRQPRSAALGTASVEPEPPFPANPAPQP
jgi:hypothetical protein